MVVKSNKLNNTQLASYAIEFIRTGQSIIKHKQIHENIVMIMGRTGIGKGTLLHLLCDDLAIIKTSNSGVERWVLDSAKHKLPEINISHSTTQSDTFYPGVHSVDTYTYVDCPGDSEQNENKDARSIANAYFRKAVTDLPKVANIKVVFVLDYKDITDTTGRGQATLDSWNNLVEFLGDLTNPAIFAAWKEAISLVVTKVPRQSNYFGVGELLKEITEEQETLVKYQQDPDPTRWVKEIKKSERTISVLREQLTSNSHFRETVKAQLTNFCNEKHNLHLLRDNAYLILNYLINNNRFEFFSDLPIEQTKININCLFREAVMNNYNNVERQIIFELIHKKTKYIPKTHAKFSVGTSENIGFIEESIKEIINIFKEQYCPKILSDIKNFLKESFLSIGLNGLPIIKEFLQQIRTKDNVCTIDVFIKKIHATILLSADLIKESQICNEMLQFLITYLNLLPEKARKDYLPERKWCAQLELYEEFEKIEKAIAHILQDPVIEIDELGTMISKGYAIKTSQINKEIRASTKKIYRIEVYAFDSIIFDEDLINDPKLAGKKLQDVDWVTIIAPRWYIRGTKTIDLSGKHGSPHENSQAPNGNGYEPNGKCGQPGVDGKPGEPGKSGGRVFGVAGYIDSPQQLTLNVNGGDGAPGQKGGNGVNGKKGESATLPDTTFQGRPVNDAVAGSINGWKRWPYNNSGIEDTFYVVYGQRGGCGGNAGRGGIAGVGGKGGSVEIVLLSNTSKQTLSVHADDGQPGSSDGDPGIPGQAGSNGDRCEGTWHQISYGWNGHHLPRAGCPDPEPTLASAGKIFRTHGRAQVNITNRVKSVKPKPSIAINLNLLKYKIFLEREKSSCDQIAKLIVEKFLNNFYDQLENNSELQCKASIKDFLEEFQILEDLFIEQLNQNKNFLIEQALDFLKLYQSLGTRIRIYGATELEPQQLKVLQYLYTVSLSKTCRLTAVREPKLIIDLRGFLNNTREYIKKLNQLNSNMLIEHYRSEYQSITVDKVKEAGLFINKLTKDLELNNKRIDQQIGVLLKEITEYEKTAEKNKHDLIKKRDELNVLISQKRLLSVFSVVTHSAGLLIPGYGTIAASVINFGLSITSDSSAGNVGKEIVSTCINIGYSQETPIGSEELSSLQKIKSVTYAVSPLIDAGLTLLNNSDSTQDKLEQLDDAVKTVEKQLVELRSHKKLIARDFKNYLDNITKTVKALQVAMNDQSLIAAEYNRFEIKGFFEEVKSKLKTYTKGFAAEETFFMIIQRMEDAIETTIRIYNDVQNYQDQMDLANYIAQLHSARIQSIRIDDLEQQNTINNLIKRIQQNIILEQYYQAVAAIKQWAFPFAHEFLKDQAVLPKFSDDSSIDDYINQIVMQLELLINKVNSYYLEIQGDQDSCTIKNVSFNSDTQFGSFFVWKYEDYPKEIEQFLMGKSIALNADLHTSNLTQSAIKFNSIEIDVKSKSCGEHIMHHLNNFTVTLEHAEHSDYRYNNHIYRILMRGSIQITHGLQKNPEGNAAIYNYVYQKLINGNLSPYTCWNLQLNPISQTGINLYDVFKDNLTSLEIHLVGQGTYVDEASVKSDLNLDEYYGDSEVVDGEFAQTSILAGTNYQTRSPLIFSKAGNVANFVDNDYDWIDVGAGGNCLFLSIADQLARRNIATDNHMEVRVKVADYISEHWDTYKAFIREAEVVAAGFEDKIATDLSAYEKELFIRYLKQSGVWGDNISIRAAAAIYNANIVIRSRISRNHDINAEVLNSRTTIYIGHIAELHYQSLWEKQHEVIEPQLKQRNDTDDYIEETVKKLLSDKMLTLRLV